MSLHPESEFPRISECVVVADVVVHLRVKAAAKQLRVVCQTASYTESALTPLPGAGMRRAALTAPSATSRLEMGLRAEEVLFSITVMRSFHHLLQQWAPCGQTRYRGYVISTLISPI